MPEVTGLVNDPVRGKSYMVRIAGSDAAEVFAFNLRVDYDEEAIKLESIPTVVTTSGEGDMVDASKAKYILADIVLQDIPCKDGKHLCRRTNIHFVKQATIQPYDNMTMIATSYLTTGEIVMAPLHPGPAASKKLIYPINLIEINSIMDLETPIGLAIAKKKMFDARASVQSGAPQASTSSHFQPIQTSDMDIEEIELGDNTGISSDSAKSTASSILAGTLNTGRGDRAACGRNIERSLTRAVSNAMFPDFTPWMTSTGSTPPSSRPHSAQSLPAELNSPENTSSPERPKSSSPTKKGRKMKRLQKDSSYQPKIRNFLLPSPGSPVRPRMPLPNRSKRRSQRSQDTSREEQPPTKKVAHPNRLDETVGLDDSSVLSVDRTQESVIFVEEVTKAQKQVTIDLDNDLTPENSEKSGSASMEVDTSNEAGTKGGSYSRWFSGPTVDIQIPLNLATPPISASSSRSDSMTTHRPTSVSTSSTETSVNDPSASSAQGPSTDDVSFHTNIPLDKKPHHVMVKASKDNIQIKILTFKPYNIANIVKCFYDEQIETDNPGSSEDTSTEEIVNTSSTTEQKTIASTLKQFASSSLQTFSNDRNTSSTQEGSDFSNEAEEETTSEDAQEEDAEEDGEKDVPEGQEEGEGNAN